MGWEILRHILFFVATFNIWAISMLPYWATAQILLGSDGPETQKKLRKALTRKRLGFFLILGTFMSPLPPLFPGLAFAIAWPLIMLCSLLCFLASGLIISTIWKIWSHGDGGWGRGDDGEDEPQDPPGPPDAYNWESFDKARSDWSKPKSPSML